MKLSAGLLMYRRAAEGIQVFLVHPGGPFFAKKDKGFWGIPKGLVADHEPEVDAAVREFVEETAISVDPARTEFIHLGAVRQKSGKQVYAWAFEGDVDPAALVSNTFEMEWPPRTGRKQTFPEVDRGEWFEIDDARAKINEAQRAFLDRLLEAL